MRALAILLLAACNGGTPPTPTENPVEPVPAVEPAPAEPAPAEPTAATEPDPAPAAQPAPDATPASKPPDPSVAWGDSYTVMSPPKLSRNTLTVDVRYGGGCAEHVFTPRSSHPGDGHPTRLVAYLHHEANDDRCRAIKYETVTANLGDLMEDCVTEVLLQVPSSEDGKSEYLLPMDPPQGCD